MTAFFCAAPPVSSQEMNGGQGTPAASGQEQVSGQLPDSPSLVPAPAPDKGDQDTSHAVPEEESFIESIHTGISRGILGSSEWLDSFFYDPRYAAEENHTRMIVRLDVFDEKHAHTDTSTHMQFKLQLPMLKKKANIVVAGDPDEQTEDLPQAGAVSLSRPETDPERNVSSSLGYFFKSDERRNVNARVGIRYRHGDVVTFIRPHYRGLHKLDGWSLRFTQELPWWSDTKWESLTVIDLEREFPSGYFLRTSAIGHWYDDRHGYFYTLAASLVQALSPRRALSYELSADFETRPEHRRQQYKGIIRFRQRLWKDWMYYEIAPQVRFPRDQDFDAVPGVLFRLEMFFGRFA